MATRRLLDLQKEVIEARSRLTVERWERMGYDVSTRLSTLKDLIGKSEKEMHRHVVVSLIAALQTYFRGTVVSICNIDETYRVRAATMIPEKFAMKDALEWIGGKTTSFGELVAHMAPCNSCTDIIAWLDGLLACNLTNELSRAVSEYDHRNGVDNAPLLIPDVGDMLATLADTFRLRHILAHEAASTLRISAKSALRMWEAVNLFISGITSVLWKTAYYDKPLTQFEMNRFAHQEVEQAQKQMTLALENAETRIPDPSARAWLKAHQEEWLRITDDWYACTFSTLDGTMWPAVAGADRAGIMRARAEQISLWATVLQPDDEPMERVAAKLKDWFEED